MSTDVTLKAEQRTDFGKGAARTLRRAGLVPAVVYGSGADVQHVVLPAHAGAGAPTVPPIAYALPCTALVESMILAVGISCCVIQVSVAGSYCSTVEKAVPGQVAPPAPPMAYILPPTAVVERNALAVGILAFRVHVSVDGSYSSTVEMGGL